MAEVTYEGMFLLDSNRYAANADGMQKSVLSIIERAGGTVVASRPWQDAKLAYPIEKHRRGMYFLTYFTLESTAIDELIRLMKFNDAVIRHLILALDPALVEPMVAMAQGRGEVVSTFRDTDAGRSPMDGIPAAIEAKRCVAPRQRNSEYL